MSSIPSISSLQKSYNRLKTNQLIRRTPCEQFLQLSEKYGANIYLKREDLQIVQCFQIREVINHFQSLGEEQTQNGVVCCSDGHFGLSCSYAARMMKVQTTIFLPSVASQAKIDSMVENGGQFVHIQFVEGGYEETILQAEAFSKQKNIPFLTCTDRLSVEAVSSIGFEIIDDQKGDIDYLFCPVGSGTLLTGVLLSFMNLCPETKIIGVQPEEANSLTQSLQNQKLVKINQYSRFCDGSSVAVAGSIPFQILKEIQNTQQDYKNLQLACVPEGKIASTVLELFDYGILVEPAGALAVSVLDQYQDQIKGQNVVCLISGSITDFSRFDQFKEISMLYEGLKCVIKLNLAYKPGCFKEFVLCLDQEDEIQNIKYNKRNNREEGNAIVGVVVQQKENIDRIIDNLKKQKLLFEILTQQHDLYSLVI